MATVPRVQLVIAAGGAALSVALGVLAGMNPALGLGAALGIAYMLIVLANLYAGLILFILVTFFADLPGYGSAFTVSKFAGLVLGISWLASLTRTRAAKTDFPSAHPFATWILLLFLGWIAVTQLWAEDVATSRDALLRLSLNAALVLVIFTAVRTPKQAAGVCIAFVAGACFDALYGLASNTHVDNAARLTGSVSRPGELAAALVAGLVLSLGLAAVFKREPILRLLIICTAALCAVGVLFTGSRGGLIALAAALAAFLLIGARWRSRVLLLIVAVALGGWGFFSYLASPDLKDRVTTVGSGSGRVDLWTVGWRMVEDRPLTGIGIGNYPVSSVHYVLTPGEVARGELVIDTPKVAHNTYLEIWAETGLVGLILFLFIVGFCVRSALIAAREFARRSDVNMELIARALFVAQIGFLVGAFFASREYTKDVWLVLALGPAILAVARSRNVDSPADASAHREPIAGPALPLGSTAGP